MTIYFFYFLLQSVIFAQYTISARDRNEFQEMRSSENCIRGLSEAGVRDKQSFSRPFWQSTFPHEYFTHSCQSVWGFLSFLPLILQADKILLKHMSCPTKTNNSFVTWKTYWTYVQIGPHLILRPFTCYHHES